MPRPPLPPELHAFLAQPNAAVIATVLAHGSPVTVATWYDWEDGRVLVNMDAGRRRVAHLRADRRVSLTVMDVADWSAHVSVRGRAVSLADDDGLRDSDRLARRYTREPYPVRDRARLTAWIGVDRWHAWHPESL